MNPILLKPNSETGSQVIVQGRPVANMDVRVYHAYKSEAFARVKESFDRLAASFEVVILEGAGSIAEVNLREHDIANLRAAQMADAPVLLVADIDRGGVFASIVGTLALLEPQERSRIAGVLINKFRGDPSLLASGIALIEERTGVPVLGVIPWLALRLPEEDSLALARKTRAVAKVDATVRIVVVRLPHLSNYTDFDPLEREEGVELLYLDDPSGVGALDLLILPGTKNTLEDLAWLRRSGFAAAIVRYHRDEGITAGICGGFQMLGRAVNDPDAVESSRGEEAGLGLLDAETVLRIEKQTHQVEGHLLHSSAAIGFSSKEKVRGYEIHMGETVLGTKTRPLLKLMRLNGHSLEDGAVSPDGRVWGTYLHGFFDNDGVRRDLLNALRRRRGLPETALSLYTGLDAELDRLADHLEAHLDLELLLQTLGLCARKVS